MKSLPAPQSGGTTQVIEFTGFEAVAGGHYGFSDQDFKLSDRMVYYMVIPPLNTFCDMSPFPPPQNPIGCRRLLSYYYVELSEAVEAHFLICLGPKEPASFWPWF